MAEGDIASLVTNVRITAASGRQVLHGPVPVDASSSKDTVPEFFQRCLKERAFEVGEHSLRQATIWFPNTDAATLVLNLAAPTLIRDVVSKLPQGSTLAFEMVPSQGSRSGRAIKSANPPPRAWNPNTKWLARTLRVAAKWCIAVEAVRFFAVTIVYLASRGKETLVDQDTAGPSTTTAPATESVKTKLNRIVYDAQAAGATDLGDLLAGVDTETLEAGGMDANERKQAREDVIPEMKAAWEQFLEEQKQAS